MYAKRILYDDESKVKINSRNSYIKESGGSMTELKDIVLKKGDIVVAKDGFLDKGETLQDTLGIVIDYNPENDFLVLGTLHPEKYALPHTYSMIFDIASTVSPFFQ